MGFTNYSGIRNAEKYLKKEKNINNETKGKEDEEVIEVMDEENTNENMITLDSLLNQNQQPIIKAEKELINYPTIAKIQSFNSLSISPIKVGEISTDYDKFLNSIDNKMIYR